MRRILLPVLLVLAVFALAWWRTRDLAREPSVWQAQPVGVMGTGCSLVALAESRDPLAAAEAELRGLEARLSGWIESSEISILNRAAAGEAIGIGKETREVLAAGRRLHVRSEGAFDVTAGPLIARWRQALRDGAVPAEEELLEARQASTWADFELAEDRVVKARSSAQLDLDGLAKGYAIDRALEALLGAGATSGMVEVGGDLRVAGPGPEGESWAVGLRSPFEARAWGTLYLRDAAVCTSGPYHRGVEIGGRLYSHILDPRSLQTAEAAVSTTVVAAEAVTADGWATALAVLGPAGLDLLPEGIEALVVTGSAADYRAVATAGFAPLLMEREFEIDFEFR